MKQTGGELQLKINIVKIKLIQVSLLLPCDQKGNYM